MKSAKRIKGEDGDAKVYASESRQDGCVPVVGGGGSGKERMATNDVGARAASEDATWFYASSKNGSGNAPAEDELRDEGPVRASCNLFPNAVSKAVEPDARSLASSQASAHHSA